MLRWIYWIGLLWLPTTLSAQWKVIEKSIQPKPAWVGGAERNYLIVSAEAPTLEAAKEKLLVSLKQQIVGAIATRIFSETQTNRQQTIVGKAIDYTENTTSFVKAQVAHVPFVSEVSLSKAKAAYWEKQYDKKRKIYQYEYHVKYLFTDFEVQALVSQFNQREDTLNSRLKTYAHALDQIENVEQIDRTLRELKAFLEEFDPGDPRHTETEQLLNAYRQLYRFIDIREEPLPGSLAIRLALYLKDRRISSLQKPQLSSNCAEKLSYEIQDGYYQIRYDDTPCYAADENYLEIRFRFGNHIAAKKIYFQ